MELIRGHVFSGLSDLVMQRLDNAAEDTKKTLKKALNVLAEKVNTMQFYSRLKV